MGDMIVGALFPGSGAWGKLAGLLCFLIEMRRKNSGWRRDTIDTILAFYCLILSQTVCAKTFVPPRFFSSVL